MWRGFSPRVGSLKGSRGLGHWMVVMLDLRGILASAQAVWVIPEGLGCWLEVMLDGRAILASS